MYKAGGFPYLTYVDKEKTVSDVNEEIERLKKAQAELAHSIVLLCDDKKKLTEALEAYQNANRIHNDAEAALFEMGEEALGIDTSYRNEK